MTEEQRTQCTLHEVKLVNLETTSKKILKLLQGNGEMGINTKASLAYNDLKQRQDNKNKLKVDVYRWVIFAILAFIAAKVHSG